MHCPACKANVPAGTKKCPKCGKPALASTSDEIDLMPMDEPKPSDPAAFNPHPEPTAAPQHATAKGVKRIGPPVPGEGPPPIEEPMRMRAGAMAAKASNTNLIIGGVVALILVLFIGWRMLRTENKIVLGKDKVETSWMISANQAKAENLDISGVIKWTLDITPTEDTVLVGVVPRNPKDPMTIAAFKKLPETYEPVKKGETKSLSGEFKTGQYSWVVMNETKKPVRVKVKFKAQP
jgi:hypothetical protein